MVKRGHPSLNHRLGATRDLRAPHVAVYPEPTEENADSSCRKPGPSLQPIGRAPVTEKAQVFLLADFDLRRLRPAPRMWLYTFRCCLVMIAFV